MQRSCNHPSADTQPLRQRRRRAFRLLSLVLVAGLVASACSDEEPQSATVTNFFVMEGGDETPFGEPFTVTIDDGVEVPEDVGNIYVFDFTTSSVQMSYSSLPDFDGFERVLEDGFSDVYYIDYGEPVLAGLTAVPDESQNLVPIAEVISDTTLRIELTTGMEIGDGQTLVVDLVG